VTDETDYFRLADDPPRIVVAVDAAPAMQRLGRQILMLLEL
jgi:hypothetical protein